MRDLYSCPTDVEYYHCNRVIKKWEPFGAIFCACKARTEDERPRDCHENRAKQMPSLSLTVRREAFNDDSIAADAHKRRKNSIGALSDKEEKSSVRGGKSDNFDEVYDEVSEPNSGAQVVEDMARGV